jgi:glycine/D-amino acid oxidase-like deaminating enzyme
MAFPTNAKYPIIGAGIHGLSTAFHLAQEPQSRGRGSGEDILVLDKTSIGAGASGIAEQQKQIGYESVFVEGAKASADDMRGMFDDWQAEGKLHPVSNGPFASS